MSLGSHVYKFDRIDWIIGRGSEGDTLYFEGKPITENLEYLSRPITDSTYTGLPLTLYFPIGHMAKVLHYPGRLSVIDILGAINTFYSQPITLADIDMLDEEEMDQLYEIVTDVRRGKQIPRIELLEGRTVFKGLTPYRNGYAIDLEFRIPRK